MKSKRSHRLDRLAKLFDAEILPLWSERFGRLLLRRIKVPPKAMVLDVGGGTGYPALEVLRRMDDAGRVVSIDPSSAMLDVARDKAGPLGGKRIFFRSESAEPKLSFADEVFDVVTCNLALAEMEDPARVMRDFARVCKPDGRVLVTVPLSGTFEEFHDLLREVLIALERKEALARLDAYLAARPTARALRGWLEGAGLRDVTIDREEYQLLFKSSSEFFFAPVIEFGPLTAWKEIAGGSGEAMQEVFWRAKEAIDRYFAGRPFVVTVRVACASGRRPTEEEVVAAEEAASAALARAPGMMGILDAADPIEDGPEMAPLPALATTPDAPPHALAITQTGAEPSGGVPRTLHDPPRSFGDDDDLDSPTGEITLHTGEVELIEATGSSFVGTGPDGGGGGGDPEDREGSAPHDATPADLAELLEPDSEILTTPGTRRRRR